MVDVSAVMERVRGMVVEPQATMARHVQPVPPWGVVAKEHTLPILFGSAIVSTVLIWLLLPQVAPAEITLPGPLDLLIQLVLRIAVNFGFIALMAGVVAMFAGMFGGRRDFDASYVLVALSLTPLYLGEAVMPLPVVGPVAALAGLVYAMVVLYRSTPSVLSVPAQNRGKHIAMTLLSMILISLVIVLTFGPLLIAASQE